jgi:hypothetical protein
MISFAVCDGVSTTNSLPVLALSMYRAVDLSSRSRHRGRKGFFVFIN